MPNRAAARRFSTSVDAPTRIERRAFATSTSMRARNSAPFGWCGASTSEKGPRACPPARHEFRDFPTHKLGTALRFFAGITMVTIRSALDFLFLNLRFFGFSGADGGFSSCIVRSLSGRAITGIQMGEPDSIDNVMVLV